MNRIILQDDTTAKEVRHQGLRGSTWSLLTISNTCDRQMLSGYKGMLTSFHIKYLKAENESALGLSVLHYIFSTSSISKQLHCPSNTLLR